MEQKYSRIRMWWEDTLILTENERFFVLQWLICLCWPNRMFSLEWIEVGSAEWHLLFPSQRELGGLVFGRMQISSNSNMRKWSHCCKRYFMGNLCDNDSRSDKMKILKLWQSTHCQCEWLMIERPIQIIEWLLIPSLYSKQIINRVIESYSFLMSIDN